MLQVTVNNVGDIFVTFFCILQCIFHLVFFPEVVQKQTLGKVEKQKGHLMASCVRNIHTKNYENLIIFVHLRIENVWDVFFETQCTNTHHRKLYDSIHELYQG